MNMGYGIKHYVLKEEASLPSIGYNDVVQRMIQNNSREWLPWSKSGLPLQVKSQPKIKSLLLGKESVKQAIAQQIIVNEHALKRVKQLCASRKGPIIFCPTHRSYIDFLLVSAVLYYYDMEVPHICAGDDFLSLFGVADLLRMSGAYFMRRSFRDDPLYKAIFTSYVEYLCQEKMVMEFFIEGTRSRTNKMMTPKFGIL